MHDPNIFGFLGPIIIILGLILAIMWIIMPITVFGIKNRLDKIINIEEMILQIAVSKHNENKKDE